MKLPKSIRRIIVIAAVVVLAILGWTLYRSVSAPEAKSVFKIEKITRTDLRRTISATGTVEPEELVNVGAQVNGKIMSFGKDAEGKTVDYGSRVTKGMLLAQIDDVTYQAALQEAEASMEQAEASILSAEAAIKESDANTLLAKNNWERAQTLYAQKSMTLSDYDSYQAAYLSKNAEAAKATAQLAHAKAAKSIAEAALSKTRRNVEYCTILSPVDGVVIDRRVSVGQTVVSNQSASSIFLVARDFAKMQVWVSVNEADIGNIKPGMKVTFSCDAFPNTEFQGVVHRVRLNATLSSNVVTYIVEVNCDNKDGKLIPYLTANVKFIRAERLNVLAVSTAALRYNPPPEMVAEPPEMPQPPAEMPPPAKPAANEGVVWIAAGPDKVRPVRVRTGLTSNAMVEIISDELHEGDEVVTGTEIVMPEAPAMQDGKEGDKNPFMPNMPKPPARGSAGQRERAAQREKK